jgi:hypothetical protein
MVNCEGNGTPAESNGWRWPIENGKRKEDAAAIKIANWISKKISVDTG